jgi:hypothetical protein
VSEAEDAIAEVALEQIHQLLVEVKDYLEGPQDMHTGLKLAGKVELTLENWNDDAFFDPSEADEDDGGDILEQLAESGLDDEDDEDEDEDDDDDDDDEDEDDDEDD